MDFLQETSSCFSAVDSVACFTCTYGGGVLVASWPQIKIISSSCPEAKASQIFFSGHGWTEEEKLSGEKELMRFSGLVFSLGPSSLHQIYRCRHKVEYSTVSVC